MKLLFNPNTNVGVYVKHMRKTNFPIDNTKRGNYFQMCAVVRSAFLPLTLRLFVCRIDFFPRFNHLEP